MNKNKIKFEIPRIINGGVAIDKRGKVSFVNDFDFTKVKRFYMIATYKEGVVRAWHGHKIEAKYVFVLSGKAMVAAVRVDDWEHPSKKAKIYKFLLSQAKPAVLCIPKGFANGFKPLAKDTKLIFFSTLKLEESNKDDFRFDAAYWDIWD